MSSAKAVADGAVISYIKPFVDTRAPRASFGLVVNIPYRPLDPEHIGRTVQDKPSGETVYGHWDQIVAKVDIPATI